METLRGDIFYVNWEENNAPIGSEQRPGRPAIIVSNDAANAYSPNVTVVYLTTQEKPPLPTRVKVVCRELSTALCEQVHTISKSRLGTFVRTCTAEEMEQLDRALMAQFGISISPVAHDDDADKLRVELNAAREENEKLRIQLVEAAAAAEGAVNNSAEIVRLTAERDVYKGLVDKLLATK